MREDLKYIHQYEPGSNGQQNVTLLLLHGTGGNEENLRGLGRMLMPGAGQLRPRGNVWENGLSRFFRRFDEGVLDVDDLKKRAGELTEFLHEASERYGFDERRVIAGGFSNGANMIAGLLLLRPDLFRSALLFHPMVPFVPESLPDLGGKPVFIGGGRADPLVSSEQTEQLAKLLTDAGAHVHLFWQNGGHTITSEEVKAAKSWLNGQQNQP